VVTGDKVFVASDPGFLVCYDKITGKQLWMRDTTAYDFVTDAERRANPELFEKIDADVKSFRKIAYAYRGTLDQRRELNRLNHDIRSALKKVDKDKYYYDRRQEPGNAGQPMTDGRFVYVWYYSNNIAACFDLEGNRIWKNWVPEEGPQGRHGYYRCPMLIGDDFAMEVHDHIFGFDRKTGKINWRIPYKFNTYSTYNQELRERSDETDIISFRDMGLYKPGLGFVAWSSVTRSGDNLYGDGRHRNTLIRHKMIGGGDQPFEIKRVRNRSTNVGKVFTPGTFWSPAIGTAQFLVHDGLLYAMGFGGVLRVYEADTLNTVYERQLDFAPVTYAYPYPYGAGVCASPALGGKYIYLWGINGTTIVIEPGRDYKEVAKNRIESAIEGDLFKWHEHFTKGHYYPECTVSSPIFDGKRIYYRAEEYFYCIGEER
jgi:outer membrane protein assembly factor BamB